VILLFTVKKGSLPRGLEEVPGLPPVKFGIYLNILGIVSSLNRPSASVTPHRRRDLRHSELIQSRRCPNTKNQKNRLLRRETNRSCK
jgi:hypothetical protein